ncbi:MAG: glycosyltransferase family 4 protein [Oscillochloridaceae bacterium umkhey_bin13]
MPHQVLLTISGVIPADLETQVAEGKRPRADYQVLGQAFGADLLDVQAARAHAGWFGHLIERLAGISVLLAWVCFLQRHRYQVIVTDGENVGVPLACLFKLLGWLGGPRPRHLMIVHILSVPKKLIFFDYLRIQHQIDTFLVYAEFQQRFIHQRLGVPIERVVLTPFMVDSHFFRPDAVQPMPRERPMICAVGLERRDYPTLLAAVADLPIDVVIAAASPWSRRTDSTAGQTIPANVRVQKFSQYDLRQLYADSRLLVMPLEAVEFQAGVTAILEALAMARPVLCSRTLGQTDVISPGEHGFYVPPGDVEALRTMIMAMLDQPELAARMGREGRQLIERQMSLEHYAEGLAHHVRRYLPAAVPA